jgi:hypothetical protein
VGSHIATELDITLPQGVEDSSLHRTDIGHGRVRIVLKAVHDQIGDGTRRHATTTRSTLADTGGSIVPAPRPLRPGRG